MNPQFWWYLTRSSGIVAWAMLTASVIWGILLSTKAFPDQRRPAWLLTMHRWLAGLTMSFLAIHLAALVADSYVSFDLADLAVPFASDWKPGAVALGVVAMWLLVAIQLTSFAMRRLPRRVWRIVHLSSYVGFWLTSLHAAFAGTDATSWLYRAGAAASILAVAWSLMYRVANRRAVRRAGRMSTGDGFTRASRASGSTLHGPGVS
ncbi:MAG: ferric reductase-like transmembrane domain-containing protein [Ilumatobacteraceae bacterium]